MLVQATSALISGTVLNFHGTLKLRPRARGVGLPFLRGPGVGGGAGSVLRVTRHPASVCAFSLCARQPGAAAVRLQRLAPCLLTVSTFLFASAVTSMRLPGQSFFRLGDQETTVHWANLAYSLPVFMWLAS